MTGCISSLSLSSAPLVILPARGPRTVSLVRPHTVRGRAITWSMCTKTLQQPDECTKLLISILALTRSFGLIDREGVGCLHYAFEIGLEAFPRSVQLLQCSGLECGSHGGIEILSTGNVSLEAVTRTESRTLQLTVCSCVGLNEPLPLNVGTCDIPLMVRTQWRSHCPGNEGQWICLNVQSRQYSLQKPGSHELQCC